jgi:hypothetical protein
MQEVAEGYIHDEAKAGSSTPTSTRVNLGATRTGMALPRNLR